VTTGGKVYGALVANERAKLGLTQKELAAKVGTSPSTIARIEQGHPPRPETRKQLAVSLNAAPSSALHLPIVRKAARVERTASRGAPSERPRRARAPRQRPHRPSASPRLRWIAAGFAVAAILAVNAGRITSSGSTDGSSLASALPVSNVVGAPTTIHKARIEAQKRAAAEARRARRAAAAERRREREAAAAAAAEAAARRAAKERRAADSVPTAPVTPTVSPSPPPVSSGGGGGGGGGGSSGSAPELQHGIGSGGTSSGSGSSSPSGQ
jgi:transcriptional regulator with XRE-family HTH domain